MTPSHLQQLLRDNYPLSAAKLFPFHTSQVRAEAQIITYRDPRATKSVPELERTFNILHSAHNNGVDDATLSSYLGDPNDGKFSERVAKLTQTTLMSTLAKKAATTPASAGLEEPKKHKAPPRSTLPKHIMGMTFIPDGMLWETVPPTARNMLREISQQIFFILVTDKKPTYGPEATPHEQLLCMKAAAEQLRDTNYYELTGWRLNALLRGWDVLRQMKEAPDTMDAIINKEKLDTALTSLSAFIPAVYKDIKPTVKRKR